MELVQERIAEQVEERGTHARRSPFLRYLALLFVIPVLAYLAGFLVVRLPDYERWSGSQWGPVLEYGFTAHHEDADVVIFGDSSAIYGIDETSLGSQLGVKTLNLPNTVGSLPVTQDMALADYVRHNRAPKLIVIYMSPWNLDYLHLKNVGMFEGEEMLARHGNFNEIARFVRQHTTELLLFPFRLYRTVGKHTLQALVRGSDRQALVRRQLGHINADETVGPLSSSCTIPSKYVNEQAYGSAEALVAKYATPATKVMLYMAPIPGCTNAAALQDRPQAPGVAQPAATLPANDFFADPLYAHLRVDGMPAATRLLADAVRPELAGTR